MKTACDNSIRFDDIQLENYGVFQKKKVFRFKQKRTVFTGGNGTGKTTIVNALAHLGASPGAALPGVALNEEANSHEKMSVNVSVAGCSTLVAKYTRLIFLGSDAAQNLANDRQQLMLEYEIDAGSRARLKSKERDNFGEMLGGKSSKINLIEELDAELMATGETVCLGYAFAFAVREVLSLDVPAVFDSPYGLLDPALKKGASEFFQKQECQQIYLGPKAELSGEVADYDLNVVSD